jgi:hypothetical protein
MMALRIFELTSDKFNVDSLYIINKFTQKDAINN